MSSGWYGASQGAPAEPMASKPITIKPKAASRCRSSRRRAPKRCAGLGRMISAAGTSTIAELDPRIDQRDGDVGEEIAEDYDEGADHQDRHEDRIIAHAERVDEEQAHAGPAEDGLRNQGAADQQRQLQAGERDQRRKAGAQRMIQQDARSLQALGLSGADIILVQNVQHRGPRIAAPLRDKDEGQHGDRENEMAKAVDQIAAARAGDAAGG